VSEKREKGADEKFCSECGEIIRAKAEICPKCGVRQMAPPPVVATGTRKSRGTAGVLALFLGGLGAQDFYLGNFGSAIVAVLFCWTFLPAIYGFFVGLNFLLFQSDQEFDAKWNKHLLPPVPVSGTAADVDWQ
jgi:TM2 domain-containing membrane protein YozV